MLKPSAALRKSYSREGLVSTKQAVSQTGQCEYDGLFVSADVQSQTQCKLEEALGGHIWDHVEKATVEAQSARCRAKGTYTWCMH
jgi:hypothetical protein